MCVVAASVVQGVRARYVRCAVTLPERREVLEARLTRTLARDGGGTRDAGRDVRVSLR